VSATSSGAGAGVVFGIVVVLLAQQFAYLDLNPLITALTYVIIGAVIGGLIFGAVGWALGRSYEKKHPEITDTEPTTATPPP
jgi:ABC-type Fe3+-siderophore transport system permease subunit